MPQILKSKTMLFALALSVFGVIESQLALLSPYMSPQVFGLFTIVVSVSVAVLRVLTTTPLNEK